MKKFFIIFGITLGLTICCASKSEASHFSFSIGGMVPPVVVMDTYRPYYSFYTPYYNNSFYFSTRSHHRMAPRPHKHGHHFNDIRHGHVHVRGHRH